MSWTSWSHTLLITAIIVYASIQPGTFISTDHRLNCNKHSVMNIKSPNFPNRYNDNEDRTWKVFATPSSRLIVRFIYFDMESADSLRIRDRFGRETTYTGVQMSFPPYLSLSDGITLRFLSDYSGKRTGFNLTVDCYSPRDEKLSPDLIGGAAPDEGQLIIRNGTHIIQLCSANLLVAATVCNQLGYPGARAIHNWKCKRKRCGYRYDNAPLVTRVTCSKHTFRLEDCTSQATSQCSILWKIVDIYCQKPGYLGCFDMSTELPQGEPVDTVSACTSHCASRRNETSLLAIHTRQNTCHCVRESDIDLRNYYQFCRPGLDENEGLGSISDCEDCSKSVVYNVSVGLCGKPDDVINGVWRGNDTRYGSNVTVKCDTGYELEDNTTSTLQCLEGEGSVYVPVWNGTAPVCRPVPLPTYMRSPFSRQNTTQLLSAQEDIPLTTSSLFTEDLMQTGLSLDGLHVTMTVVSASTSLVLLLVCLRWKCATCLRHCQSGRSNKVNSNGTRAQSSRQCGIPLQSIGHKQDPVDNESSDEVAYSTVPDLRRACDPTIPTDHTGQTQFSPPNDRQLGAQILSEPAYENVRHPSKSRSHLRDASVVRGDAGPTTAAGEVDEFGYLILNRAVAERHVVQHETRLSGSELFVVMTSEGLYCEMK